MRLPLRIDFAGSWLDVPRFAIPGAYVVNMAISPLVELINLHVQQPKMLWDGPHPRLSVPHGSGLGTSAAWRILSGHDATLGELASGAGWQDPAVIQRTGVCVWASGPEPVLVHRDSGEWLRGLLAIHWTGKSHCTADIMNMPRDYTAIANASVMAFKAVQHKDAEWLSHAMFDSNRQQVEEGMDSLPYAPYFMGRKYCGAGHGGYAVYLFDSQEWRDRAVQENGMMAVEPYCREEEICLEK